MQCEDNSKLRTPLNEVCMTTDIGCVPIVNGQPQCSPMPDELPIAYDKTTSTLWLFECDSRTWIAHKKFTMEELQDLNLENLNNICSILKIGVFYNPGTGTIQGNVSLGEFAEQLLKCLDLETKVVTVTQGENNTIKISIEGLDGLPPTYIKGDNVWFTGTGTEGDPVVVHTYDPICKWAVASQSAVDAATTKHLGACLDGQPSRVPYPPEPCEYPSLSKAQVDAAGEKRLIACVDGESVKVPWVETPCEYERVTGESVAAASDKDIIACVDGKNVKIPIPDGFFADTPCDYPRATQDQVTSASEKDVIVCLDGKDYKIPIPSAFFDPEFLCIPEVLEMPTDPPPQGTGPIRAGCNGEIYLWVCEQNKWIKYETSFKHDLVEWTDDDRITLSGMFEGAGSSICDEVKFHAWYNTGVHQECYEDVQISAKNLVEFLQKECNLGCCQVGCTASQGVGGGWCLSANPTSNGAIFSSRTNTFIRGSGEAPGGSDGYERMVKVQITNKFNSQSYLSVVSHGLFLRGVGSPGTARAFYILTEDPNELPWYSMYGVGFDPNNPTGDPRVLSGTAKTGVLTDIGYPINSQDSYNWTHNGDSGMVAQYKRLMQPNETVTIYGIYYIWFSSTGWQYVHCWNQVTFELFNNFSNNCDSVITVPEHEDIADTEAKINTLIESLRNMLADGTITEADVDGEIERAGLTRYRDRIRQALGL